MDFRTTSIGLLSVSTLSVALASSLYFPTAEVNLTLPSWTLLPKPLPPLIKLRAAGGEKTTEGNVLYRVLSETTSGLFVVDGDEVRVNGESFTSEEILSRHQSAVVGERSAGESANATINLSLTGDKINCGRAKRSLCFWDGASYRIRENQPPTPLGQLSSQFLGEICKNYSLAYQVFKAKDYVGVGFEKKSNMWILSTRKRLTAGKTTKIRFGVNCTVTSLEGTDHFLREFDLAIAEERKLEVSFDLVYEIPPSNVIRQPSQKAKKLPAEGKGKEEERENVAINRGEDDVGGGEKYSVDALMLVGVAGKQKEKIARGSVTNPSGSHLDFSLTNDIEGLFDLKCMQKAGEAPIKSSYDCEVTTKKTIRLSSPYEAYVVVNETSLQPHRLWSHNITLIPSTSGLEKLPLLLSTNPEENFLLGLKYPESVEISRRAVVGTRVAEPILGGGSANADVRRRVVKAKIKFEMLSGGFVNVTRTGGIVFVNSRSHLKETRYKIKITGIYPNGYRFVSTVQVNVTDKLPVEDPCEKLADDKLQPSCSEKRFKSECEKTCGVSSGVLKRTENAALFTSGCIWRSNEKPEKLSRLYQTCSPDLSTCPDRFCDPLEVLFPKICPQDCTEYVFGSANKENHLPGIASATGVCSCDNRQKCLCALLTKSDAPKQNERRKSKEILEDTATPRQKEAISAVKASDADQCGLVCFLSVVGGSIILIFGISFILLLIYRRRLKKRCPNQRPMKENMVNMNYEEYVERPGDILRPLTQGTTLKEIPEYFDKKWEFPRHRLTIEETIGEGEFGRVLKARADGIGGHDGSITVAVKTLKDNAKESELADLISEYQLLKEIDHPNVIHLLGACTKLDGPLYIIIEYAKHGSLRNYLRKYRHLSWEQGGGKESGTITPKDILTFAWQIAKGMSYLTEMKLVHRDLAARNVLVAEGLICKISDFGLTRDIYEDDTYLKRSKGRVPVKWMALESLADHVYTTKSDVWSYGVVLWELVTTGASPYPGIAGQDLFHLLKSGYRMEKPANCSGELYQILRSCWHESPSHRPTFKSLVVKLEEMLGEGKDYLDLNPRAAINKTYFGELLCGNDEGEAKGVFALEFKMFENPNQCGVCEGGLRYENEKGMRKPKYENEGMEYTGYVQPRGKPKRVEESNDGSECIEK